MGSFKGSLLKQHVFYVASITIAISIVIHYQMNPREQQQRNTLYDAVADCQKKLCICQDKLSDTEEKNKLYYQKVEECQKQLFICRYK